MMIESTGQKVLKVLLYVFLIITAAIMILPFLWMHPVDSFRTGMVKL